MAPVTFGLRAAAPHQPRPPGMGRSDAMAAVPWIDADTVMAALPLLTVGFALLLGAVFTLEVKLGFGSGTTLDDDTLTAFGGTSWAAVVGRGEIWRVPLGPLMHASLQHLLGNAFSLLSIGLLLEPLVGHGWFAAIVCLGALGATAASIAGNPETTVSVGASGAIMALVAAAFVLSWHPRASQDAAKMVRRSLVFGVPALLPMLVPLPRTGAVQVDDVAHLGGAFVGVAVALGLQYLWPDDRRRPRGGAWAGAFALAWLLAVVVAAGFAVRNAGRAAPAVAAHQAERAALAARFIPVKELPAKLADGIPMAETFVRRYPQDPRSHLLQALAWQTMHDAIDTERELQRASDLIDGNDAHLFDSLKPVVTATLALAQLQLGRPVEARATARGPCQMEDSVRKKLVVAGLCR